MREHPGAWPTPDMEVLTMTSLPDSHRIAELLLAMAIPAAQIAGLVILGLIFRVDRKPKGGT